MSLKFGTKYYYKISKRNNSTRKIIRGNGPILRILNLAMSAVQISMLSVCKSRKEKKNIYLIKSLVLMPLFRISSYLHVIISYLDSIFHLSIIKFKILTNTKLMNRQPWTEFNEKKKRILVADSNRLKHMTRFSNIFFFDTHRFENYIQRVIIMKLKYESYEIRNNQIKKAQYKTIRTCYLYSTHTQID